MMKPRLRMLLLSGLALIFASVAKPVAAADVAASDRWESEIAALESIERSNPHPPGGVVFVGSSSIRMWKTLSTDFPAASPINRGFGGSQTSDCVQYFDRLVGALKPRLVVYYCGGNDIAAGKKPEEVASDFRAFCAKLHATLPETRLIVCSIKITPSRWQFREQTSFANTLIAAHCAGDPRRTFLDINSAVITPEGQPRTELYLEDRLHLNAAGYAVWKERLAPLVK